MIIGLWRWAHFVLALICSLFLIVVSISGAILALEPILDASKVVPSRSSTHGQQLTLRQATQVIGELKIEALLLRKDPYDQLSVEYLDPESFEQKTHYLDIDNKEWLGPVVSQKPFFKFVTNLHRSLFMKSIGRAMVGIVSFLLIILVFTGMVLLARRFGGWTHLFSRIQDRTWALKFHIRGARLMFFPILLLASTGVYLTGEKFNVWGGRLTEPHLKGSPDLPASNLNNSSVFDSLTIGSIKEILFPFSLDSSDYYEIKLDDREWIVHQYTGQIIRENRYPFSKLLSLWSLKWHTGRGQWFWALLLGITSAAIPIFIVTGFTVSAKRLFRNRRKLSLSEDKEAAYIVLVGSETGATYHTAQRFAQALFQVGKKVYLGNLNDYKIYPNCTHLIVLTSTYGQGDPPNNARHFIEKLTKIQPIKRIHFAVVGFGSKDYPNFCQFAERVQQTLIELPPFEELLPLKKMDDTERDAFDDWVNDWNEVTQHNLTLKDADNTPSLLSSIELELVEISSLSEDHVYTMLLKPLQETPFESGDLLRIIPPNSRAARLYSIGKWHEQLLLCVRLHPHGICSSYLFSLTPGTLLKAQIQNNSKFHFPNNKAPLWMVANGTGIAPFLGMLQLESNYKKEIKLFWGGRNKQSFRLYLPFYNPNSTSSAAQIRLAFSREEGHQYVQDLLPEVEEDLIELFNRGGTLMVCGALDMEDSVCLYLQRLADQQLIPSLEILEKQGLFKSDCY